MSSMNFRGLGAFANIPELRQPSIGRAHSRLSPTAAAAGEAAARHLGSDIMFDQFDVLMRLVADLGVGRAVRLLSAASSGGDTTFADSEEQRLPLS